jgi:hypothetical protein
LILAPPDQSLLVHISMSEEKSEIRVAFLVLRVWRLKSVSRMVVGFNGFLSLIVVGIVCSTVSGC